MIPHFPSRYDTDNSGAVNGITMLRKMGITMRPGQPPSRPTAPVPSNTRRHEETRKRQLDVEFWLKEKFRAGFYQMKAAFEEEDSNSSGLVSDLDRETPKRILQQYKIVYN